MSQRVMIVGTVIRPGAIPVSLQPAIAFAEFSAGHAAYFNRQGPGRGRIRAAGWLQAHREEMAELEARAEERREQCL